MREEGMILGNTRISICPVPMCFEVRFDGARESLRGARFAAT